MVSLDVYCLAHMYFVSFMQHKLSFFAWQFCFALFKCLSHIQVSRLMERDFISVLVHMCFVSFMQLRLSFLDWRFYLALLRSQIHIYPDGGKSYSSAR